MAEPAEVNRTERMRRLGLAVGCAIGGVGAGIMLLVLPFVTPAFRKFTLPYVPATSLQLERVLGYAAGRRGKVVDLGSGDGRGGESPLTVTLVSLPHLPPPPPLTR